MYMSLFSTNLLTLLGLGGPDIARYSLLNMWTLSLTLNIMEVPWVYFQGPLIESLIYIKKNRFKASDQSDSRNV